LDIARTIESYDERYQVSNLRYPYNNVTISDSYWDNRDTVRRQEDARAWCFKAYKEDPGPRDIHVRLWPPPRASQLTTAVQHLHKNDPSSQQQRQVHESPTSDATHRGHNDNSTNDNNQRHNGDNDEELPDEENDRGQNGDETSELSSEDDEEDKDGDDASDNDGDRGENNDGNGNNDDDDLNIGK
jgi:hypothetical protein